MPHRRLVQKGSFAAHFDELVKHFQSHSREVRRAQASSEDARRAHQEKRDVHALLFEHAWRLNSQRQDGDGR